MTDVVAAAETLAILLVAALIPSLLWLLYIRRTERYEQEPWSRIFSAFLWGAVIATLVAAILEVLLLAAGQAISTYAPGPEFTFLRSSSPWNLFFTVLVVAPFVEEALKGAGTVRSIGPLRAIADGPVIGASVGLGFGFFETFLYGFSAFLAGGLLVGLLLILIRSVSSVLLHASSTAMFGYGYAKGQTTGSGFVTGAYYLLAVTMHATFNLLASLSAFLPLIGVTALDPTAASVLGLLAAIIFATAALQHVRTLITESSYPGAYGTHPSFRPPPVRRASPPTGR